MNHPLSDITNYQGLISRGSRSTSPQHYNQKKIRMSKNFLDFDLSKENKNINLDKNITVRQSKEVIVLRGSFDNSSHVKEYPKVFQISQRSPNNCENGSNRSLLQI